MQYYSELATPADSDQWAIRSDNWIAETAKLQKSRKRRERNSNPLILCGNGVSLRIEHGALVIRDGFTHYPQEQARYRYFPGSLEIPTRILLLDGSGTISFDVLSWLGDQGVVLARVKWTGEITMAVSGSGFASDREKVEWQHKTRSDEAARMKFAADLIQRKLTASIETLSKHIPQSKRRNATIDWHSKAIKRLRGDIFTDLTEIRAIEAQCASQYFNSWAGLELIWIGRRPIPENWRRYISRSSDANGVKPKNYNASHPLNAMLNYAYAIKSTHLQIRAIADGYDPTLGIMHHGRRGKPAFIFDLIEPERPLIDAAILSFAMNSRFTAADFIVRADGACRLSPQLARTLANVIA